MNFFKKLFGSSNNSSEPKQDESTTRPKKQESKKKRDPIVVSRVNNWNYTYTSKLKDLIENIPGVADIGEMAAYRDVSQENFKRQLEHVIAKLEQAIEEEIFAKENELAHLQIIENSELTDHKILEVQLNKEIEKIKREQEKVKNQEGYYKSIYKALYDGFTVGKERKTREMLYEHKWKEVE